MLMLYADSATPGIYAICIDDRIVYVGKTRDLYARAKTHKSNILNSNEVWYPLARDFHQRGHLFTMKILAKPEYKDLDKTEKEFIEKFKPLFNCQGMSEKGYQSISYDIAVNKLFLGYRPPLIKVKEEPKDSWFGEQMTFRKW